MRRARKAKDCAGEKGALSKAKQKASPLLPHSLSQGQAWEGGTLWYILVTTTTTERERETGCWVAARSFFGGERDEQCCAARNTLQGKLSFLLHFPFLFPWDAFGGGYILLKRDIRVFTAKEGPSII